MKELKPTVTLFWLALAATTVALASDPGERQRAEDVVLEIGGLHAEAFLPPNPECSQAGPLDIRCFAYQIVSPFDAEGSQYFLHEAPDAARWEIWRTRRNGQSERVAYVEHRTVGSTTIDAANFTSLSVDLVRGFIYVWMNSECFELTEEPHCNYGPAGETIRIEGLETLAEVSATDDDEDEDGDGGHALDGPESPVIPTSRPRSLQSR